MRKNKEDAPISAATLTGAIGIGTTCKPASVSIIEFITSKDDGQAKKRSTFPLS